MMTTNYTDSVAKKRPAEKKEPAKPVTKRKNRAAVELAKRRAAKLSPERRREIGVQAGHARASKLSPERRSEIARKAGKAGAAARWGKKGGKKSDRQRDSES